MTDDASTATDTTAALESALQQHEAGHVQQAERQYRELLQAHPDHAGALHLLGLLLHQTGRNDAALDCLERAIAADPSVATYHNSLGAVCFALQQTERALACYRQSLHCNPAYAEAFYNLGVALERQGLPQQAVAQFRQAIACKPGCVEAHYNLGILFKKEGQIEKALACFHDVIRLQPDHGRAQHLIATLSGQPVERAPDQYVAALFDDCAAQFDTHLVQTLQYDTPQRLLQMMRQCAQPSAQGWDVLDLGCGTGLAGLAIAPHARQLVGVDLSGRMLAQARVRNIYQRLEQDGLLPLMQREAEHSHDVILAADVFIYTGALDAIFAQAGRLLREGGLFAFSVEALDALPAVHADDYHLSPSGRYAHAAGYLRRLAATHGFKVGQMTCDHTRLEQQHSVQAWLTVLIRQAA
jgi:predicted TPR repeat methyltransferase